MQHGKRLLLIRENTEKNGYVKGLNHRDKETYLNTTFFFIIIAND